MKPTNKIMMFGLVLFPIIMLMACASLHTGKVTTDAMVKITKKRIPMDAKVMALCFYHPELYSPHTMAEADIYANHTAIEYRKKNPKGFSYPVGSIFVKKKYSARLSGVKQEKPDDIGTVMAKKTNTGKVTDWEFNFLRLDDGKLLKPKTPLGQHSCIKCHQAYKSRGYISRESEFALQEFLSSLK